MSNQNITMHHCIEQTFQVSYHYKVYFTHNPFEQTHTLLKTLLLENASELPVKVLIIVDEGVVLQNMRLLKKILDYFNACDQIELSYLPILFPGGEKVKNDPKFLKTLLAHLNDFKLCRHSFLIAIGGGSLLDFAGFSASIAHRGIKLIRMPTTVLAQNDSGVGVKTSFNYFDKKNFLGTFSPPYAVINDSTFLKTLDQRNWQAGISEALKVALIKDRTFFDFIKSHVNALNLRDLETMEKIIFRSAQLHIEHIGQSGDPFETGQSKPLDFGHWAAHKLEQLSQYELLHGEAVAIGIALDCTYAHLIGLLSQSTWRGILKVFENLKLNLYTPLLESENLFSGLKEFQEHLGGKLTLILIEDIGKPIEIHEIDMTLMKRAIETLQFLMKEKNDAIKCPLSL